MIVKNSPAPPPLPEVLAKIQAFVRDAYPEAAHAILLVHLGKNLPDVVLPVKVASS